MCQTMNVPDPAGEAPPTTMPALEPVDHAPIQQYRCAACQSAVPLENASDDVTRAAAGARQLRTVKTVCDACGYTCTTQFRMTFAGWVLNGKPEKTPNRRAIGAA